MSSTFSSSIDVRPEAQSSWRRGLPWLAACTLLLVEYLLVSHAFDFLPLSRRRDWLAVLGSAGNLGPIALTVATATLLVGGRTLLADLRNALELAASEDRRSLFARIGYVALHLVGVSAFFALSRALVGALEPTAPDPLLIAGAWLASGVVAFLALAHALLPLPALTRAARKAFRALALGTALGILAWGAGLATLEFWDPLAPITLHGVAAVLGLVSSDLRSDPATATLAFEAFQVVIARECSGYEGIGLLAILTASYLWAFRSSLRFPQALAILPVGIALVWLANVLRIAALMVIGARWSSDLALGSFHSKAGWVFFCAIALGLVALTQRASFFSREAKAWVASTNPTAAYLAPLLVVVGVYLVTDLFQLRFPVLYPLGVAAGAAMLWKHRSHYRFVFRPAWSLQACGLGFAAFVVWSVLEPAGDPSATANLHRKLAELSLPVAALWITFRVLGSVVVVPVVEELAFRGYLLRRFLATDFTSVSFARFGWASFLGSSVAFGLLHERWLAGILAGMLFALAQYRRGRLDDAIQAHAVTNLLIAAHAIGWQRWSLWT